MPDSYFMENIIVCMYLILLAFCYMNKGNFIGVSFEETFLTQLGKDIAYTKACQYQRRL